MALCGVDWDYASRTFQDYPNAKRYIDWRIMLDEMGKSIDAVVVATPRFNRKYVEFNAKQIASEWIHHTYREGWRLPEMPA